MLGDCIIIHDVPFEKQLVVENMCKALIFLSQNIPFSRHFVTLEWPKWHAMGSNWAHSHLFAHPKWSRISFGKTKF